MIGNATTNGGAVNYTGVPLLAGTGFTAALFGDATATDATTFQLLSSRPFQTSTTIPGIINGATISIPWVPVGSPASTGNFEVRVWDNRAGTVTTWAQVLSDPTIARGRSAVLNNVNVLVPPATPGGLTGIASFNLFIPVPEPSLIALGALGLGALLLRRRKA